MASWLNVINFFLKSYRKPLVRLSSCIATSSAGPWNPIWTVPGFSGRRKFHTEIQISILSGMFLLKFDF